jgi:hypothetical protein
MPNRQMTKEVKLVHSTSSTRNAQKMIISAMNISLRPNRSDIPPRHTAPTKMPIRLAALMKPFCAGPMPNWREISGSATPVIKTTKPSKNFPAAASAQIRHCMPVIGTESTRVPSGHIGRSSI